MLQLLNPDFEKMASEIEEVSKSLSQDELFEIIGNGLYDEGLDVSEDESFKILVPKVSLFENDSFVLNTINYVQNSESLSKSDAKKKGERFWNRFKDKLQKVICNDPNIKALISGDGELKDYIKTGIPIILGALGLALWNPVVVAIITAVFALIIKVGWQAYCEVS